MKKLSKKILALLLVFAMLIPTGALMVTTGAETEKNGVVEFNGHYYKVFYKHMAWTEAKGYCESIGGYLVAITSSSEQSFISNLIKSTGLNTCWIGLTTENLTPQWVTGEKFEFSNWAGENPDNSVSGECYVHIYAKDHVKYDQVWQTLGQWNDIRNDMSSGEGYDAEFYNLENCGLVCEWNSEEDIDIGDSDDSNSLIPHDAVMLNGHYYKLFSDWMGWLDAKAYCESLGGHLVSITSAEENKFVTSLVVKNANVTAATIGFTDEETEGTWKWVTGESSEYSNWGSGEPNNQVDEDYAFIGRDGSWNDGRFARNWPFVCEWEPEGDVTGEYYIAGKKFDKNIDYYTANCSSSVYNPELANMTAALSAAAYGEDTLTSAYASLGFTCELFDYSSGYYNPLSSGCAIGYKKSSYNDDTIILISVRGSIGSKVTGSDWHGNYTILTDFEGKHVGFSEPANRIYDNILNIIENNKITGNIKYVITGHSRGAAVANLLAVKLMEKGVSAGSVYNYNYACPDVACRVFFNSYSNIFNICNRVDIVPHIPGELASTFTSPGTSWGKYGTTLWFTKDAEDTHDIYLYLNFVKQNPDPSEWQKTVGDVVFDNMHDVLGWVTKIFCPVDVIVKDADGNIIASVIGGEVNYYDSNYNDVVILTDGDKKVIFVSGDNDFNVELIGTDDGTMTYSVEKCNLATEEISESKTFENVKLEKGKEMYSPVSNAETTEDVELFVVDYENEENVITHTISTDGTETEIYHIYETEVVKPTCTEKGYTNHVCLNCDDSYKDTYVDATGHSDANHDGICDVCADDFSKGCSCNCHGNAFMQFLHKIVSFLRKLFGMTQYQYCDCGKAHW